MKIRPIDRVFAAYFGARTFSKLSKLRRKCPKIIVPPSVGFSLTAICCESIGSYYHRGPVERAQAEAYLICPNVR